MPSTTGYSRIPLIQQPQVWAGAGLSNIMHYYTVPVLTDNFFVTAFKECVPVSYFQCIKN
jgi:hypothetical protein